MSNSSTTQTNVWFYMGNFTEIKDTLTKASGTTVQRYVYTCEKSRNLEGQIFGFHNEAYIEIRIKNFPDTIELGFLQQIKDTEAHTYTLLFDATFDTKTKKLHSYTDYMVLTGYPVDITEELFSSTKSSTTEEQKVLKIKILLQSIQYPTESNNLTLQLTDI